MRSVRTTLGLSLVLTLAGATVATAAPAAPAAPPQQNPPAASDLAPHVAGRVIVGFQPGTPAGRKAAARSAVGATGSAQVSRFDTNVEMMMLGQGRSVEAALKALQRNPNVRFAEPDYLLTTTATSNDPDYTSNQLWGMYGDATTPGNQWGSQAGEAWAAGATGSSDVYVVVIDEGIDVSHPDLAANIWTNPFDPVDGVDNDGNGYIDDVNGWDFVADDRNVYDAGGDTHGTHVAGTIGAVGGNGIGVVGVNWDVTMISAKFLGTTGGSTTGAIRAVDYATDLKTRHGLNIVATSNSWGGGGYSQALLDAINRGGNAGILFVAAAGNSTANNDTTQSFPSNYQCTNGGTRGWDCVVAVASTTNTGGISSFSSFGATTVDLGAPGSSIKSTLPANTYGVYSGTSMATPHVSGAVALCASVSPTMTAAELRAAVIGSTAATASLAGKTVTGGRLDVGSMRGRCAPTTAPVSGQVGAVTATATSRQDVRVSWDSGTTANHLNWEIQRSPAGCASWAAVGTVPASTTATTITGHVAGTTYCYRVRGTSTFQGASAGAWSATATATTPAPPAPYQCSSTTFAWVDDSTATAITLADDASANVTIPFTFTHYETPVTSMSISSNGFVRLGGTNGSTSYDNVAIPNAAEPNGIVAPWWDDLNPGAGGRISTRTDGTAPNRRFVITWNGVPHFGAAAGDVVSFQVVLEETTNAVVLQYLDATTANTATNRGAGATTGIESLDGTAGTQVSLNVASLTDSTAVRCSNGSAVEPVSITTSSLPTGTATTAYSATLATTGGTTPSTAATSTFTVRATDAAGRTATRSLSIAVAARPGAFAKSSPSNGATGRSRTSLQLSWGASTAVTRYEICWDTVNDNVCNTSWVSAGTSRSIRPGTLLARTVYYWQVRSVNAGGTTYANASTTSATGTWWRFTTGN